MDGPDLVHHATGHCLPGPPAGHLGIRLAYPRLYAGCRLLHHGVFRCFFTRAPPAYRNGVCRRKMCSVASSARTASPEAIASRKCG